MYVAEFRKEYNHHTQNSEWKVKNVYEKQENSIWYKNILTTDYVSEEGMRRVVELNHDTYAYKIINEEDIAISGNRMDCTVANSKFNTYKDF